MRYILFLATILLPILPFAVKAENKELASLYQSILLEYNVFPPVNPDPNTFKNSSLAIEPIEVVLGTTLISIDDISPGDSEFTITMRTLMYRKKAQCNLTKVHQQACGVRLGGGQGSLFVTIPQVKESKPLQYLLLSDAHQQAFIDRAKQDEQPDVQFSSNQVTLKHRYDLSLYPFEFHELKVTAVSAYTKNVVSLTALNMQPDILRPTMPPGWTFHGMDCSVISTFNGNAISFKGGNEDSKFDAYDCTIKVARENHSWWLTSFFLAAGLCTLAVAGNLGNISHEISEARDDKDLARRAIYSGTRLMGTFTVGLLLTYVFQVEVSPYGRPIEYWPTVPASSKIYILGMSYILIQSMFGLLASILFPLPLKRDGFIGRPSKAYNLEQLPQEGKVEAEILMPLLQHAYKPEDGQGDTKEQTEPAEGQVLRARLGRDKQYNVLSVEEAIEINKYVKQLYILTLSLALIVCIVSCVILGIASAGYHSRVAENS